MGKRRMLEIVLAFLMLSLGMLMGWRALFDPAFLPQRGVPPESLTLEEFLKLSSTNLNTATLEELMELPVIGEALARRILE